MREFSGKLSQCCYGENAYQAPSFAYQTSESPFAPDKFKLLPKLRFLITIFAIEIKFYKP